MRNDNARVRGHCWRLRRAPRVSFAKSGHALDCPRCQGVYLIFDPAGKVAHVGRTTRAKAGLAQRLKDHLAGRSSFVINFLKNNPDTLGRGFSYSFIEVAEPRLRALLEAYATGVLCPQQLGTGEAKAERR
jgi:hypothetical protein